MFANVDWFDFIFGGIVVGLIVNLLSSYLYPKIETFVSRFNKTRRDKKTARALLIVNEVSRLKNDPHEEMVFIQRYFDLMNYQRGGYSLAVLFLLLSSINTATVLTTVILGVGGIALIVILRYKTRDQNTMEAIWGGLLEEKGRPGYETW